MSLAITLTAGTDQIELPDDLVWRDEFDWTPVEQSTDYGGTGSLIVQEGERQDGRPITLYGGKEGGWASRATIEALYSLASTADQQMTLSLWGRSFNVIFRRPAMDVEPIRLEADPLPDHWYAINSLNLMEINP